MNKQPPEGSSTTEMSEMSTSRTITAVVVIAMVAYVMFGSKSTLGGGGGTISGTNKAFANVYQWQQSASVVIIGFFLALAGIWCLVAWAKYVSSQDPDEKVDDAEIAPTVMTAVLVLLFLLARWWKRAVSGMNNQTKSTLFKLEWLWRLIQMLFGK